MNMSDIKRLDREHVIHLWSVQAAVDPLVITKTHGVYMWDENGKCYLDMFSQQVNHNIGHQHPKVVQAIKDQAEKLCFVAPGVAYESRSFCQFPHPAEGYSMVGKSKHRNQDFRLICCARGFWS